MDWAGANCIPAGFTWLAGLSLLTLVGTYFVTWWATKRGVYEGFKHQENVDRHEAEKLSKSIVGRVNTRLGSWELFEEQINEPITRIDSFKTFNWSVLDIAANKISIFSFDGEAQQDIIALLGLVREFDQIGAQILDEKNLQINKCQLEGRQFEKFTMLGTTINNFSKFKMLRDQIGGRLRGVRRVAGYSEPEETA